jgi:hypothetical protein
MKRFLGWSLGFVVVGSLLGGCVAVVDPFPGIYLSAPRVLVGPPRPTVVAPRPRGWYGHQGYGWQRRGYR